MDHMALYMLCLLWKSNTNASNFKRIKLRIKWIEAISILKHKWCGWGYYCFFNYRHRGIGKKKLIDIRLYPSLCLFLLYYKWQFLYLEHYTTTTTINEFHFYVFKKFIIIKISAYYRNISNKIKSYRIRIGNSCWENWRSYNALGLFDYAEEFFNSISFHSFWNIL